MSSSVWFVEFKWAGTGRSFLPLITSLRYEGSGNKSRPSQPGLQKEAGDEDMKVAVLKVKQA